MKIISRENAGAMLGGMTVDTFVARLTDRLQLVVDTYSIPGDSGRKTALSRLLAHLLFRDSSVCVYVSGWGVWGSAENLDLFYGYRRSLGEERSLSEAPIHLFESRDTDSFVSILCMVLYFIWDAWVYDIEGNTVVRISHDEWLEIHVHGEERHRLFADELEQFSLPVVAR